MSLTERAEGINEERPRQNRLKALFTVLLGLFCLIIAAIAAPRTPFTFIEMAEIVIGFVYGGLALYLFYMREYRGKDGWISITKFLGKR